MRFYTVAVAAIVHRQNAVFTYHSPLDLPTGSLVRVPLGKHAANGVVMGTCTKPSFDTRPISDVLYPEAVLPPPLIKLAEWMSRYYVSHLGLVLQSMLPPGLHKKRRVTEPRPFGATRPKMTLRLTPSQKTALQAITQNEQGAFLLHGVPGSGKTQVYIEAAKATLAAGKSVIVLVPEIGLTTQLIAQFSQYFRHVHVIHSGLTEAQRHLVWQQMLFASEPAVVIGPRSALFSPLAHVGMIVIDECHEQSFKQDRSPRYNALYAASTLTKLHRAKIVLGSATPNVSELYLAKRGRLVHLELPTAIQTSHNKLEIVPHNQRTHFSRHRFISTPLIEAIHDSLAAGEQSLVFHNRRGTTPSVICDHCGWQAACPSCQLPLTFHGDHQELRCHTCNYTSFLVHACPQCANPTIVFKGVGTKLVATELARLFPKARIARFDADNAKEDQLQERYQALFDGHIDILVGTQIIAKGLDLPRLSTVGVLQADAGLHLPDFSAAERTFQLLYQVSGRAGRHDKAGRVILQTYTPDARPITLAAARDFHAFARSELAERRTHHYPPFWFLLKLVYSGRTERAVVRATKALAQRLAATYPQCEIAGPAPAFHEHQNDSFHWQILVKSPTRGPLVAIASDLPASWQFDIDPMSLL